MIKYCSSWSGCKKSVLNYTNKFIDDYKLLKPYEKDLKTGEFLNDSVEPKLVKVGKINVYERIQSYKDDCNIYKILERVIKTGDEGLLNISSGSYADITGIPTNIHDMTRLLNDTQYNDLVKKLEVSKVNDNQTLINSIDDKIKQALASYIESQEKSINNTEVK